MRSAGRCHTNNTLLAIPTRLGLPLRMPLQRSRHAPSCGSDGSRWDDAAVVVASPATDARSERGFHCAQLEDTFGTPCRARGTRRQKKGTAGLRRRCSGTWTGYRQVASWADKHVAPALAMHQAAMLRLQAPRSSDDAVAYSWRCDAAHACRRPWSASARSCPSCLPSS